MQWIEQERTKHCIIPPSSSRTCRQPKCGVPHTLFLMHHSSYSPPSSWQSVPRGSLIQRTRTPQWFHSRHRPWACLIGFTLLVDRRWRSAIQKNKADQKDFTGKLALLPIATLQPSPMRTSSARERGHVTRLGNNFKVKTKSKNQRLNLRRARIPKGFL